MTRLTAQALTVRIGPHWACRDLDLQLGPGESWGVLGGNGVGKTTLLHTLAGLRKPAGGRIAIDGIELRHCRRRHLARRLGVLFQDSHDAFPATVLETALTGRHPHHSFWSFGQRKDVALAEQALARLQLLAMRDRQVDTLSGGERRRLAIAALFLQDPVVWLLDEPTNHLDLRRQIQILELVSARARERQGALMMVLHDVNLLNRYCTHGLLMLGEGRALLGPVAAVVNKENLESLYQCQVDALRAGDKTLYVPA